ncbi:MAG: hypothetical protein KIT31_21510 [Deltaproteobacteria bacterium]|nr:hypothetical protein [Deltaproteobacteria bacterium]
MEVLFVPDDFRAFMKRVVAILDAPSPDRFLDAEDALRDEVGYGGRVDGAHTFAFTYITRDGRHRWTITLEEAAIREIADGLMIEVTGEKHDLVRGARRATSGDPLLIWGEYGDDALRPRDDEQVYAALDSLHASALDQPRMLRMWSAADDQLVAFVCGDRCALYVIESAEGYATSTGDAAQRESFEAHDHDGRPLAVPHADCVPWDVARAALMWFLHHGDLGDVVVEGRLPTALLMLGETDRKAILAHREEPPRELAHSSLPRMLAPIPELIEAAESTQPVDMPPDVARPLRAEELSAWARRLLELLDKRELIELRTANLDELAYQLGGLLQAHGVEAQHSIDTAEWLANEIGAVRGVAKLFATGGDLQIALRRSRDV